MKKVWSVFLTLLYIISFSGCCLVGDSDLENVSVPPVTDPPPMTEPATQPPETEPEHSELYIPDLPVEDVIVYFDEVCLDAEINNSGDPSRLQKWVVPICYQLNGSYTQADLDVFLQFTQWLNTIEGFPGIREAQLDDQINLHIFFCTQQEMTQRMGENFSYMDGGVTFWYNEDEIFDAIICYRTDLDQYLRNSVILEEIYNGLGPIQDTALREDSIIYTEFSQPQALTQIDELLLRLLYHPEMQCGMNAEECENIIRRLYY